MALLIAAGCGTDAPAASPTRSEVLDVVAAFYPLQFAVERVGGDHVSVTSSTPAGAEPHDLELSAQDVASLQDAAAIVYLSGFMPALDDAVADVTGGRALDVALAARLRSSDDDHDDHDDHDETHDDDHGDDGHDDDGEHEHEGVDPHFWLDPIRLADVADAIAVHLTGLVPAEAASFEANAAALRAELEALDADLRTGLAECASTDLVTSHTAFAYLADRYGFTQLGISGLSPDEEPSPGSLAEVADFVREHGVTTVYYETLVDPAVAETVASETGAMTAVLDPIEGLTAESAGGDYVEVMRSNLETLRAGQGCT